MHVLVTGGGGFLGFAICKQLKQSGFEVTSLARNSYEKLTALGVNQIKGDICNVSSIKESLRGVDAIIHTAAKADISGPKKDFENINYLGTKNLLEQAILAHVKYFIYTSSPSVIYPGYSLENADEKVSYPKKYFCHYARTKALAEKLVLKMSAESELKVVVIRPHLIWGEGDPHIFPRLLEKAKKNKLRIIGEGTNLVDVIHVDNAAFAHVQALKKLRDGNPISGKVYFVGQERPVVLWDFINKMLATKKIPPIKKHIPMKVAYYLGACCETLFHLLQLKKIDPPMTRFVALQMSTSHYFDHKAAEIDLDYRANVSIEEGLTRL